MVLNAPLVKALRVNLLQFDWVSKTKNIRVGINKIPFSLEMNRHMQHDFVQKIIG